MPTTARGIWTPSDTDAVDFTTHLATMAGTIDTALTNLQNAVGAGANAYRGTAAQRAAFLATAVVGQLWQDTDSITMLWKKVGAAWVPAAWRWQGTTAQMNAFTVAPNGFSWFNTTDNSEYVRLAGAWALAATKSWVFRYTGGSLTPDALRVLGQITTTDVTIPAGTVIRAQVQGLGTYGTTNLGIANFKYNTTGAPITTASTSVPSGTYRRNQVSGVVDTINPGVNFVMPSSGVLSLGLTWDRSVYSDPWTLEVSI